MYLEIIAAVSLHGRTKQINNLMKRKINKIKKCSRQE